MSLSVQFQTMISMIAAGGVIGVFLDTYGRFLKRPKKEKWIVFFYDFLFWLVQGLIVFYILLYVNQGELRFYLFLALLCGFAAYQSFLHSIYVNFLERIIITTIKVNTFFYRLFLSLVVNPIRLAIQVLLSLLLALVHWTLLVGATIVKLVLSPIKWILYLFWKMTPKKIKNFFYKNKGIFIRIKNIIVRWWKRFRR